MDGENHFAAWPTALYGLVLLMAGVGLRDPAAVDHRLAGSRFALAFGPRWVSLGLYVLVALEWLIPDRRIERVLGEGEA